MERNIVSLKRNACLRSEFSNAKRVHNDWEVTDLGRSTVHAGGLRLCLARPFRPKSMWHGTCSATHHLCPGSHGNKWSEPMISMDLVPHAADCPLSFVPKLSRFKVCSCTRFDWRLKVVERFHRKVMEAWIVAYGWYSDTFDTTCWHTSHFSFCIVAQGMAFSSVSCESGAVMHPYPLVVRWSATWHSTAALLCLKEFHWHRLYHHVPHIHDSSWELYFFLPRVEFKASNYFLQKKSLGRVNQQLAWEDEIRKSEAVIFLYVQFPVEARNPCCLEVEVSTKCFPEIQRDYSVLHSSITQRCWFRSDGELCSTKQSSDFHVMSKSLAAATGLLCFALGFWARKTVERRSKRHMKFVKSPFLKRAYWSTAQTGQHYWNA